MRHSTHGSVQMILCTMCTPVHTARTDDAVSSRALQIRVHMGGKEDLGVCRADSQCHSENSENKTLGTQDAMPTFL